MITEFSKLSTSRFQKRMRPAALRIYQRVWPGSKFEDLREEGKDVHVLDKEFGIDALIRLKSGQFFTIQEKYRSNYALDYMDFTQHYRKAVGTEHEASGEWFNLAAQLYFYGWANEDGTDFEKWLIMDVTKYKLLVWKAGGLAMIGRPFVNERYGKSSFYGIQLWKLKPAFIFDYSITKKGEISSSDMSLGAEGDIPHD